MAKREVPPIDWLWAAILERKMRLGIDLKQMAEIGGVTYDTMRKLIHMSPWEWGDDTRNKICKALYLKPIQTVQFQPPDERESYK